MSNFAGSFLLAQKQKYLFDGQKELKKRTGRSTQEVQKNRKKKRE